MSSRDKYSPSRSSEDEEYSRDRKSKSDKDRARKRTRSRSRSRSESRGRSRSRSRSSSRSSESKYRFRPRAPREEDWRVAPCETILLKGLPEHIRDADLYNLFTETNASPIDIRLVIRKGQRTSFAFVEFRNTSEAAEWMKRQQGMVKVDKDNTAICVYSRRSAPYGGSNSYSERQQHRVVPAVQIDWTCPNASCGFTNFRKRYTCYLCNTPRSQNSTNTQQNTQKADDGSAQLGINPCNTVLLRGLDALTDENHILLALARITSLAPKNCYVMRDLSTGSSAGYGFMEFNSVMDGKRIKDHFSQTPFEVDGKLIMVDYAKNTYSTILASLQYAQQSQQAAGHHMTEYEQQALSASNGSAAASQQYSEPDMSALQYEPVSGMYYDPITTFYYDSNSQYFYNGQTQQYMYWDSVNKTYVPVENASAPQPQNTNNGQKANTSEKDKAKNIAKEMAKWAKSQNKKSKPAAVVQQANSLSQKEESVTGLPKDMAYDVLMGNKKLAATKPEPLPPVNNTNNARVMASLVAQYEGESDEESDILNPSKHINKQELTCLLCERKFNSLAILEKHVAVSDLHKQNLAKRLQQAKTNNNQKQYRDRAQERRIQTNTVFAKEGGPGLFTNK